MEGRGLNISPFCEVLGKLGFEMLTPIEGDLYPECRSELVQLVSPTVIVQRTSLYSGKKNRSANQTVMQEYS
jgi:hypothetical protein